MPWATGSTAKTPPARSSAIGGGGQWVSPGSSPTAAASLPAAVPSRPPARPEVQAKAADGDVVGAVKELQRSDPAAREQWRLYCEHNGGGVRDPSKHPTQFVQAFLTEFLSGIRPEIGGSRPSGEFLSGIRPEISGSRPSGEACSLAGFVKEGQRKSTHLNQAWGLYCQTHGGGVNDPSRHQPQFLVAFLDFLGQRAVAAFESGLAPSAEPNGTLPNGDAAERASKRARLSTSPVVPGLSPGIPLATGVSTGDQEKDALVNRVKVFQRSGETQRRLWSSYCDEVLNGVRDPVKHDKTILESFLTVNQSAGQIS